LVSVSNERLQDLKQKLGAFAARGIGLRLNRYETKFYYQVLCEFERLLKEMPTVTEEIYSVKEVSELTGVNLKTVYYHLRKGWLHTHKKGREHIVTKSALEAYRKRVKSWESDEY
jgi:excisionase family DNA binding protein